MEQIIINTPYGEVVTKTFTPEEMEKLKIGLLSRLGELSSVTFMLDTGSTIFMSSEMIGQCVFEVRAAG